MAAENTNNLEVWTSDGVYPYLKGKVSTGNMDYWTKDGLLPSLTFTSEEPTPTTKTICISWIYDNS